MPRMKDVGNMLYGYFEVENSNNFFSIFSPT